MDSVPNHITLYESRAHVFQINPETKNSWLPKGQSAIPIAFVASIVDQQQQQQQQQHSQDHEIQSRRELRIIGTNDAGETVLDTVIMPKTTFTKRSQKFGQWIDHTGTVYGLGFNSEAELTEFVETFQQLQRDVLSPQTNLTGSQNNTADQPQRMISQHDRLDWNQQSGTTNTISETNGRYNPSSGRGSTISSTQQYSSNTLAHPGHQIKRQPVQNLRPANGDLSLNNTTNSTNDNGTGVANVSAYPRSQSMFGLQTGKPVHNNSTMSTGKFTPDHENSPVSAQNDWQINLKYENERLKQALEESSKNAGVWHNELLNLRTNNVKLTQALQESKAHVEQWERELMGLRDENKELKLRLKALESVSDPEKANEYKKEVQKYKNYMEDVQSELRKKEDEIEDLQRTMEELELKTRLANTNGQIDEPPTPQQTQKLDMINAKFEAKLNELVNVQREFAQVVDKLHH